MDLELINEFTTESQEHLDHAEAGLLRLETLAEAERTEEIAALFRGIHSIKGAAGFLNLQKVSELSHGMETVLGRLRDGDLHIDGALTDLLLSGVDRLRLMMDDLDASEAVAIGGLVAQLDEWVGEAPEAPVGEGGTAAAPQWIELNESLMEVAAAAPGHLYELELPAPDAEAALVELEALGEILAQQVHGDRLALLYATVLEVDLIDCALGEMKVDHRLLCRDALQEEPEKIGQEDASVVSPLEKESAPSAVMEKDCGNVRADSSVRSTDRSDSAGSAAPRPSGAAPASPSGATIRIQVELLDELMALAGELVLVRNQHLRWADHGDETGTEISRRFNAVTTELQSAIMQLRLQPVGHVFGKLPRQVRDLSRKLGKEIDLVLEGETTEVDKTILEGLADPLVHIIRNCCDHGIEDPETRLLRDKPRAGTITVSALTEGGQILIRICDDGGGIDPEKIRAKVREKGLLSEEELAALSSEQTLQLIALPGFSTAATVSDVSGRGVGMDVVKTAITDLGGKLQITSVLGSGSTMTLVLPQSLAIQQSLLVRACGQRYAVPQVHLEKTICLFGEEACSAVEVVGGQEVFRHQGHLLQLVRLTDVLGDPTPHGEQDRSVAPERLPSSDPLNLLVIKVGRRRYALQVDEILQSEEIVVKAMHPSQEHLRCFLGVTVLGDGTVAPILDVDGVARHGIGTVREHRATEILSRKGATVSSDAQQVLLFTSGPQEQFALPLSLIQRIELVDAADLQYVGDQAFALVDDAPVRVIAAHDAFSVSTPELSGEIFLLLPKASRRPFAILASSIGEIAAATPDFRHDAVAEEGILGSAVVQGRLTLFPDIYRLVERVDPDWFRDESGVSARPTPGEGLRILLAEDDPFFRRLVSSYLERDRYQVVTAQNGQEALEKLAAEPFDLLLSDLDMPLVNGLELAREVRRRDEHARLPLVALSGLNREEDRDKALRCGFDDYLLKLEREELLQRLAHMIHSPN